MKREWTTTNIPKIQLSARYPASKIVYVAKQKNIPSSIKRKIPRITTGAFPERLGLLGTLKVPQMTAATVGTPKANKKPSRPSSYLHPQTPSANKADNSRKKRRIRLIGFDSMGFPSQNTAIQIGRAPVVYQRDHQAGKWRSVHNHRSETCIQSL